MNSELLKTSFPQNLQAVEARDDRLQYVGEHANPKVNDDRHTRIDAKSYCWEVINRDTRRENLEALATLHIYISYRLFPLLSPPRVTIAEIVAELTLQTALMKNERGILTAKLAKERAKLSSKATENLFKEKFGMDISQLVGK